MIRFQYPALLTFFLLSLPAHAAVEQATLTTPSPVMERHGPVAIRFRMEHGYTGSGQLSVRWSDSLGRVVEDDVRAIDLRDEIEFFFALDLSRAVAMKNGLHVHLSLDAMTAKGKSHVEQEASTEFIARPDVDGWKDYAIIMYQQYPSAIQPALERLGINGGKYEGRNTAPPAYLVDNNMRWYSENLATDYFAEYHRWRSDRPYDWSLDQAKALYQKDPASKEAFKRHPSFWDPEWRKMIHDRVVDVAKRNAPYQPFFYSLSDETGIASLGSNWDFDFSDQSLVPMRGWLRTRYGSIEALNKEWGTSFTSWNDVTPPTTNEAMRRSGENFAGWADFKEWMDISYAEALRMGVDAVHEVDPKAYVGIVGAQKPGWGGYDYSRLTRAVSVMEPYDIAGSVKLAHSLNPAIPLLSTGFASGSWEKHRVWFELLQGHRGMILWDENQRYVAPDGTPAEAGKDAKGYYNEIRDGLGALIINSSPHDDRIAVHYSQPSMRTEWMLERRPDGDAWMNRDASYERSHNNFVRVRESWGHALEDQGRQYSFVSYMQVEEGELLRHGYRMLVLPHSSSLSAKEAENIRAFVEAGGVLVTDAMPGTFDEHSRRLEQSSMADLFPGDHTGALTSTPCGAGKTIFVHADMLNYLQDRIVRKEAPTRSIMADMLLAAGISPEIAVTDEAGKPVVGIAVHVFSNGGVRYLSLQSNPQQSVNELGPPNFQSNERFAVTQRVRVNLFAMANVYDVRKGKALGQHDTFTVSVDAYEPTILAISSAPLPHLKLSMPEHATAGSTISLAMGLPATPSTVQVYHVEVVDPTNTIALQYSGNVIGSDGFAVKALPLAKNDLRGRWTVRVTDVMTGARESRRLDLE